MSSAPALTAIFARTAEGHLAAQVDDVGWLAIPVANGLRMASVWRLRKPIDTWNSADFNGSDGFTTDEAGFRAHVEDIAQIVAAAMARNAAGVWNVCDDDPAPPQDVLAHAAELLGLPIPPAVDFDKAEMTPMARSFYAENKRVRNDRMKRDLGITLRFPTYRDGLADLLKRAKG